MYSDLQYLISSSSLTEELKITLLVITRGVTWYPWVFVGIGGLLNKAYFPYWLAFSLFIFGALILVLLYMLVLVVRSAVATEPGTNPSTANGDTGIQAPAKVKGNMLSGIIGNLAFYLFIIVAFAVVKIMGLFDGVFQSMLKSLQCRLTSQWSGRFRAAHFSAAHRRVRPQTNT